MAALQRRGAKPRLGFQLPPPCPRTASRTHGAHATRTHAAPGAPRAARATAAAASGSPQTAAWTRAAASASPAHPSAAASHAHPSAAAASTGATGPRDSGGARRPGENQHVEVFRLQGHLDGHRLLHLRDWTGWKGARPARGRCVERN